MRVSKVLGECWCGKPTSRSLCAKHLKQAAAQVRQREAIRFLAGLCTKCDKPPMEGFVKCEEHVIENRRRCSAWMQTMGRKKYKILRKLGLCVHSDKHGPATHGIYCERCRLRFRKNGARRRAAARALRA